VSALRPCHARAAALLACLLALPSLASIAAESAGASASAPLPIAAVATIEARLGTLATHERPLDGISTEGARATAYLADGGIAKIEMVALGERGRVLLDAWWRGQTLIAVRERRIDYGDTIMNLPTDKPLPLTTVQDDLVSYGNGAPKLWTNGRPIAAGPQVRQRTRELAARAERVRASMLKR